MSSHLSASQKDIYKRKIKELGIIDPYEEPQVLYTGIKCVEKLPDIEFGDIYSYLIHFPSRYIGASLKAYKSLAGYRYHESGWVSNRVAAVTEFPPVNQRMTNE